MCLMHKSKTHLKLNRSIQQITKQSSAARREKEKKRINKPDRILRYESNYFSQRFVCVCECAVSVCLYVVFEYELFSLHAYKTFKSQPTGNNNDGGHEEENKKSSSSQTVSGVNECVKCLCRNKLNAAKRDQGCEATPLSRGY